MQAKTRTISTKSTLNSSRREYLVNELLMKGYLINEL